MKTNNVSNLIKTAISLCQIVEAHFFRGRFSLKAVQATKDSQKQLETDRFQDQILMWSGVVSHYHPMNEAASLPEEKGIDVWLALEAYDLAVHKRFFVPLVRKINGLGTRVLIIGVDLPNTANTSQKLIDEASYTVMLSEEVDSKTAKGDSIINRIFQT